MKQLLAVVMAATVAATCLPVFAAPIHVIVRGARPLLPPPAFSYGTSGVWSDYSGAYGDPQSRFYDPAGTIPDWRYHGPLAVDLVLARTLDHNNESILGHILACQAAYPSYSAATNSYAGSHGIPATCYR